MSLATYALATGDHNRVGSKRKVKRCGDLLSERETESASSSDRYSFFYNISFTTK